MNAEASLVLSERADGRCTLTLNNPAARNALSLSMMTALQAAIEAAGADPAVRVLVLAGAGPAFCAGHDLKELRAHPEAAFQSALFERCVQLMLSVVRCPKPVIARVHGIATAAGCQLVASCDLAIAAEEARFATPGVNIGLFCSTPMVALSRNLSRKHAMEMLLSGDMFDAQDAERFGLINRVVPAGGALEAAVTLAAKIASKSALTVKIGKRAFYEQAEMKLGEAYAHTSRVMVENLLARDADEGISAFVQKRAPTWEDR